VHPIDDRLGFARKPGDAGIEAYPIQTPWWREAGFEPSVPRKGRGVGSKQLPCYSEPQITCRTGLPVNSRSISRRATVLISLHGASTDPTQHRSECTPSSPASGCWPLHTGAMRAASISAMTFRCQRSGRRWTGYAPDCSGIVRLGSTVAGFRPHWESTPKPSKDVPTCSTDDIRSTARAWLVGPQAGEQTSSW